MLIVEDSNDDFRMLQRLMQRMEVRNPIHRCTNGDEALDFLYQEGIYKDAEGLPKPSVILLDLNLPGLDGRDVLERLKQDRQLKEIPIVVFTTSSNPRDVELCYQKGANGYLIKPTNAEELRKTIQAFVEYWLEANVSPVSP
ncbi:MAG TPA: response regulator [Stenomitos sp.]